MISKSVERRLAVQRGSRAAVHQDECPPDTYALCGFACGGVFVCPWCERTVGYCMGAADDAPALCDDCWGKAQGEATP